MNVKRKGSKGAGAVLLFVSIAVFITYAYFLLGTEWSMLILQFTALARSNNPSDRAWVDRIYNAYCAEGRGKAGLVFTKTSATI